MPVRMDTIVTFYVTIYFHFYSQVQDIYQALYFRVFFSAEKAIFTVRDISSIH